MKNRGEGVLLLTRSPNIEDFDPVRKDFYPARRALFGSPDSSVPSGVCSSAVKSDFLHRRWRFGILHKCIPHEAAAVIFRHQHSDAEVDTQDIRVIPTGERIEGVHKTVFHPCLFPVASAQIPQHAHAILKKKWKRTARRAGHTASIDGPLRWRSAPRGVASHVVRRADPPEICAIVGKFFAKRQAKEFVSLRGLHG